MPKQMDFTLLIEVPDGVTDSFEPFDVVFKAAAGCGLSKNLAFQGYPIKGVRAQVEGSTVPITREML